MRILVLALAATALIPSVALAQTATQAPPAHPHKVLTPEQVTYQQAMRDYYAQIDKLRATALAAYNAEMTREKAAECPDAANDVAIDQCLAHEAQITGRNYKTVAQAVRAILGLTMPVGPGNSKPYVGPTGPAATPATDTAALDKAEAAWQAYARSECDATDTYWRSGTIVNAMDGECKLRMARSRLHELDAVYNVTHPM